MLQGNPRLLSYICGVVYLACAKYSYDSLGGLLGLLWLGYKLVSLSVAQGLGIKPKLMR